jgi:hypothetical protein
MIGVFVAAARDKPPAIDLSAQRGHGGAADGWIAIGGERDELRFERAAARIGG